MSPEEVTGQATNPEPHEPAMRAASPGAGMPTESESPPSGANAAGKSSGSDNQDSAAPPSESSEAAGSEEPGAGPESAGGAVSTDADGKPKRKRKRRRKKKRPDGVTAEPGAEGSEAPSAESRPPGTSP